MRTHPRSLTESGRTFVLLFTSLCTFLLSSPAVGQVEVWVDPGHCCTDPGAPGLNGDAAPNEKDLTMAVANYLQGDLLSHGYLAYKTVNYSTSFLTPYNRAEVANGLRANEDGDQGVPYLFVSIHMNSNESSSPKGTEIFRSLKKSRAIDTKAYRADSTAAEYVHPELMHNADLAFLGCSEDDGISINDQLIVCNYSFPPAILIEVCYISNACQWSNIITAGDQAVVAYGIAVGVSDYLGVLFANPPARIATKVPSLQEQAGPTSRPAIAAKPVALTSLQEGFEGGTFPPTGWATQTAGLGLPHAWHRTGDPLDVGVGAKSAIVGSGSASAINEWLISPVVAIAAPDDAVKFSWSGSKLWSGAVNATLNIRQSGTTTWTQLWSLAANEPASDAFIYRERVVDLFSWNGMNVELGFRVAGTNGASFAIDDIAVGDFAPTATPSNDICSNATPLGSTFDVSGVTCYAANDLDPWTSPPGSCVGDKLNGPDVFYEISAAWGDTLKVTLISEWGAGIYLVNSCQTPVCLAGGYSEDGRTDAAIYHRFAPGGTYYLVVDGVGGGCGPYRLVGQLIASPTGVKQGSVPAMRLFAHPSPANGPITLTGTFTPAHGSALSVEIYNVEGKRLRYVTGRANSGEFSYTWDHRDESGTIVASGLYFARMRVGNDSVVEKFVILR
jgi:N-acetylmuramoyl-L-alanine amidase